MQNKFVKLPALLITASLLAACNASETLNLGYVQDQATIDTIEAGTSKEQVQLALGSPSTQSNFGSDTFYYISQTKKRTLAYQRAKLVDQRVLAIYFDEEGFVSRKANYGLKDGQVFDFISRTTPTGGAELSFLSQVLGSIGKIAR